MHAPWLWFSLLVLLFYGTLGIVQKLTTNLISAESGLVWSAVGFMLLEPVLYSGPSPFYYTSGALWWAILNGVFTGLGAWTLMAAMAAGGKASLVMPITAMYPLLVVLVAPVIFHESITGLQTVGVACALISVVLISADSAHG
jgi:bacterial/archaeal transporter family protein